jgi:hypothetical protein
VKAITVRTACCCGSGKSTGVGGGTQLENEVVSQVYSQKD